MSKKRIAPIPILLFVLVGVVGFFLSPRIGPAWDEPDNIHAAGVYIQFVRSGFDRNILESADFATSYFSQKIFTQEPSLSRYPPVPLYVGSAIALIWEKVAGSISAKEIIVAFHFATVLFFALLVVTVYRFGTLLGLGSVASLLAALMTFLFPTLFGHGLSNIKDTAQVSLFTLALYYLVRGRRWDTLKGAIIWGLALSTKFNAVYVPVIWGLYTVVRLLIDKSKSKKQFISFIIHHASFIILLGLATAILVWPYLWFDPVGNASRVISYFTTVGTGYRIFWNNVLYQVGVGNQLWWYPWTALILATPLLLLGLSLAGCVEVFFHAKKFPKRMVLAIWLVIPLLRAILPNAAFYDGIRHFMEVLPAMILLGAIGLERLGKLGSLGKIGVVTIGGLVIMQMAYVNVTFFPYATGYYNVLAKEPNTRYDRDIEALTIKEGVEYLHTTYGPVALWAPLGGHLSWYYMISGDQYVYTSVNADSIVVINKSSHFKPSEFDEAIGTTFRKDYTIARNDAVFGWVYRRR